MHRDPHAREALQFCVEFSFALQLCTANLAMKCDYPLAVSTILPALDNEAFPDELLKKYYDWDAVQELMSYPDYTVY